MAIYDEDTKLLAADTQQIKLWEFIHSKDDAPEVYSVLQVPLKVEQAFVNKRSEGSKYYYLITCKDSFVLYHQKMDKLFDGSVLSYEKILTVEFSLDSSYFYIGTDNARVYRYSIEK